MQQLKDYPILDLSGGLQQDKSPYVLKDNELLVANNVALEPGRVSKRLGSKQFGGFGPVPDTDEDFDNGIYNHNLKLLLLANKNTAADNGGIYKLVVGYVDTAVAAGATTISHAPVAANAFYVSGGTVEIEGDIITYVADAGGDLTTCTGVTSSHPIGAAIHQWQNIYAAAVATDQGTSFAYLNSLVAISRGTRGYDTYDGTTVTNRLSNSAPKYFTTYKQRIYGVSSATTGDQKVVFTGLTDPTSFPADNYFYVEDDKAEPIVAIKSYGGRLVFLKKNSTFHYDLSTLALANNQVGTFSDKTVQEINGLLYTLCPNGAFVTNLSDFKEIGKPVRDFLENADYIKYPPRTGRLEDLWVIYLGTVTIGQDTYTDATVVYDTTAKSWAVWNGFTNLQSFISVDAFIDSYDSYLSESTKRDAPTLFWGTTDQKLYRMFRDRTSAILGDLSVTTLGGDILEDKFYSTGSVIPSQVMTKFFHQNAPGWWKEFRYVRILAELWPFDIDCRTMTENGYSPWKSLGQASGPNTVLPINLEGYAIQFKIGESSKNKPWILNGLILEKTMAMTQNHK